VPLQNTEPIARDVPTTIRRCYAHRRSNATKRNCAMQTNCATPTNCAVKMNYATTLTNNSATAAKKAPTPNTKAAIPPKKPNTISTAGKKKRKNMSAAPNASNSYSLKDCCSSAASR
jgi:hypothetical protein